MSLCAAPRHFSYANEEVKRASLLGMAKYGAISASFRPRESLVAIRSGASVFVDRPPTVFLGKPSILVTPDCRLFWIREENHTSLFDGRSNAALRASAENRVNLGASSDFPGKDHVITSHPASLDLGSDSLACVCGGAGQLAADNR
jgi:hypothetical protein